jgi:sulfur-carrier protein adenylyltransferase/sulfurtransferase
MFSKEENGYYARHFALPDFGEAAQLKLKNSRVLVVGAGGLGCPILQYLVAAGVGNIGIVDGDKVDASNLHRQILYNIDDIGKSKAQTAAKKLRKLNPYIAITVYETFLNRSNALEIIKNYDLVADGTDNFPTRYLVNDACVLLGKINVFGAVFRFEGQVAVFNALDKNGQRSVNYRDLFPTPPVAGSVPDCAEGGVLGVLPGIIGALQANEVIKILTGLGEPLIGRLLVFDALTLQNRSLKISKNPETPLISELIDYELFCGIKEKNTADILNLEDFEQLKAKNEDFQLIDVREPREYAKRNMGGELIPLHSLKANLHRISKDKKIIVHCETGARSAKAVEILVENGFMNVFNLIIHEAD